MKKNPIYIYVIFIALIAVMLFGCKTPQPTVQQVPIQYKERIVERQVPVVVPADSSALFALFACDSMNQVILKELDEQKGKAQSSVNFNAGKLTYKLIFKHDTIYKTVTDTILSKEVPVIIEVPKEVNHLTRWQIGQMHIGRLFLTLLMAYGFYRLIKWKFSRFL